jgi:hypothetical protein
MQVSLCTEAAFSVIGIISPISSKFKISGHRSRTQDNGRIALITIRTEISPKPWCQSGQHGGKVEKKPDRIEKRKMRFDFATSKKL